jgi:hypothetical protein
MRALDRLDDVIIYAIVEGNFCVAHFDRTSRSLGKHIWIRYKIIFVFGMY